MKHVQSPCSNTNLSQPAENCDDSQLGIDELATLWKKNLEHPLVYSCEENPQPEVQIQQDRRQQAKPKPNTASPARERTGSCLPPSTFMEDIEIEMEVFSSPKSSEGKLVESMTPSSHTPSLNKESRVRWKSLTPQKTGLVVKDVLCLSRGHYNDEIISNIAPQGKERELLSAMGMIARITIDCEWSPNQLESRLVALFRERVAKQTGQKFSFTYLQCIQGCRVLFVPRTPAEGWTGVQVLRISGNGALYILSHHDHSQVASETAVVDREELCLEARTEKSQDGDRQNHPRIDENTDKAPAPGCMDVNKRT
ncbi:uncharacterized protein LOC129189248 isoform X2 [Dunckerocampus dactyliophorus]|uniref:uncharacterized protein LOC129189248 isoform X2 n=1 Tax=Dunckerocampus dactyliophorus TaxID=161453 RepID=UPI002406C380|nr:uncharacterized protein LOC129189248 isoform X2 [Dunckerocampus dactyliophorus]